MYIVYETIAKYYEFQLIKHLIKPHFIYYVSSAMTENTLANTHEHVGEVGAPLDQHQRRDIKIICWRSFCRPSRRLDRGGR